MGIREEVLEMKKEVQEMQEESLAMSLLKDYKKVNERMFKIIVILIICFDNRWYYILFLFTK